MDSGNRAGAALNGSQAAAEETAPDAATQRRALLVLGMHRSGTSALTRVLGLLGAELPANLLGANPTNETGHWEPERLVALHDQMLAEVGSRWDDWRAFDPASLAPDRLAHYRGRIGDILADEYGEAALVAIKDPRICRLAPLYDEVLAGLGLEPAHVLAFRNPLAVIASLAERNAMTPGFAGLLWLRHVLDAEAATRGRPRFFLSYEAFLDDWRAPATAMAEAFGLQWLRPVEEAAGEIDAYLTRRLQHHRPTRDELRRHATVAPWIKTAHEALLQLAVNGRDKRALAALDRVREEFEAAAPVFGEAAFPELAARESQLRQAGEDAAQLARRRKETVERLTAESGAKDARIAELQAELAEKAARTDRLIQEFSETREHFAERAKRDANDIRRLKALNTRLEKQVEERRDEALAALTDRLARLEGAQADARRNALEAELAAARTAHLAEVDTLEAARAQEAEEARRAAGQLAKAQAELQELHRNLADARVETARTRQAFIASTSWKLTAPVRAVKTGPEKIARSLRATSAAVRLGGGVLPTVRKAARVLRTEGMAGVRRRLAYLEMNPDVAETGINPRLHYVAQGRHEGRAVAPSDGYETPADAAAYVSLADGAPLTNKLVRLIAFYLPQFHPIPENDEWWGKGFTEWSNVKRGEPQFVGHYQPHKPVDMGYYDLRDSAVQRRQVELAKQYGIEGFCFYFYWFGGKRLLEKPVENWLNDKSLDLPFCLCWANENWSRRWDGLDQEILVAQNHSPEDDINFIREVAPYLRDERYIRVNGRPLLLLYRPSLLPSAKETAARWRNWCRENGIGEIYLAYTQSFENVDPAEYGFDAAIEFPPNNSSPPDVTSRVTPLRADFGSTIYDWRIFPKRSERYAQRQYKLFRSVCPGWDNTARRQNNGTIFINNSPSLYKKWLSNAIKDTVEYFDQSEERLVFVNAWNEWAEGAHLEPDAAMGYAYLQATRDALLNGAGKMSMNAVDTASVAIVVHAFYPDVFEEILEYVQLLPLDYKLFVTTTGENEERIRALLTASQRSFRLFVFQNHGRDVLPFLKVFPEVHAEGFEFLVKVHTKKSPHRGDGDVWRRELFGELLDHKTLHRSLDALADDPSLGMVGPTRHYVPMSTYIGSNEERVLSIGNRLGLSKEQIHAQGFFAGTMFVARLSALEPLAQLDFSDLEFEPETGQIDGTLAHAIERGLALSVLAAGMRFACSADCRSPAFENRSYSFA